MNIIEIPQKSLHNNHDPFFEFHPVLWNPSKLKGAKELIYSIKRNHGICGTFKLHNLNDAINDSLPTPEKTLVEYIIRDCSYSIFKVSDILNSPFPFDAQSEGNILGELTERISRRITKYFLKHLNKQGKTGGVFDQNFDIRNCENFIVANTQDYVLKIQQYPNLIILKHTGNGKYGYENIKELDGFFDYRFMKRRHIIVLESKLEKINVDCDDLIENLFTPLKQLFPDANFNYLLFTDKHSIYSSGSYEKLRKMKQFPARLHEKLSSKGIGTLFFHFNETRQDLEKIKDFLMLQYKAIRNQALTVFGKTIITQKELTVFDGGETPHIKLVKDLMTGLWREIPLRHKSTKTPKSGF